YHKQIEYVGMASPMAMDRSDFKEVDVHISSRDGVALFMGLDRWFPPDHVHIHQSNTFYGIDHNFEGDVYKQVYKENFIDPCLRRLGAS
ncbi:MAG: hypothetical protein KDK62_08210, partial [Chlamydiia bacterium]|nr:hypothetical protein [Chlamydiia bacterium]